MSDYSRDTFQLTNVLHKLVDGQSVTEPRHYVGVRLQQGVPLLDADWNEMEDIRRKELELLSRDIIGDGVPGTGDGFRIGPVEADNDFAIHPGFLLVGGWQVVNPTLIRYSELPRFFDAEGTPLGPDLTTPSADRIDVVYLDVFEAETEALTTGGDARLVNSIVGGETAARIERQWTVRVAEGVDSFDDLTLNEPGHKYFPLARLFRSTSARIQAHMIEDRRRLGLNLADNIKPPMFLRRGTEEVTSERFTEMLITLRGALKTWQINELFPLSVGSFAAYIGYNNALNEIFYLTTAAEVNSDTGNLSNDDGLVVIEKLVRSQNELLDVVEDNGTGVPEEMEPISRYRRHLDGDGATGIAGIQPALNARNLLEAVKGQETLNEFLLLSPGGLPEGAVTVALINVNPATPVSTDPMTLTYRVTSDLLHPDTPEAFDLTAEVSDVRWAVSLSTPQLELSPGEAEEITMTVDPQGGLTSGDFCDIKLVARAHRRPSLRSTQTARRFTIGELPPGETFFFYSGSVSLENGMLPISRSSIQDTDYEVHFTLINRTGGSQIQFFTVVFELIWPDSLPTGLNPSDWQPASPVTLADQEVTGIQAEVITFLRGPDLTAVNDEIRLTFAATATLSGVDNGGGFEPVSGGKSESVEIPIGIPAS